LDFRNLSTVIRLSTMSHRVEQSESANAVAVRFTKAKWPGNPQPRKMVAAMKRVQRHSMPTVGRYCGEWNCVNQRRLDDADHPSLLDD
jgi:hypothetical protein